MRLAPLGLTLSFLACSPTPSPLPPTTTAPAATASGSAAPRVRPSVPVEPVVASPELRAIVDSPDRLQEDKDLDAGRHPAEMLAFFGVRSGMRVADIAAAGGYTTELLARAVGPTGQVYGQNSRMILDKFAEKPWTARLARPAMKNVIRVDRELDDPLPPEAKGLDAVFIVLFYHDTYWIGTDRARMNKAIFDALAPGGVYAVIDHSAAKGSGSAASKTLHRVEETLVRDEIEEAGFRLVAEAAFLRNPDDPRDWNASPGSAAELRGTTDRFVLRFVKP